MTRPDFRAVPPAPRGLKVGLFGGTFDPAHAGHRHAAETAANRLGLHKVWWLATPQNPLKTREARPLAARMASARSVARGRRMVVSDLETRLGLRFTADTLRALRRRRPGVKFVWIMGADGLEGFHRWRRWREIIETVPLAIAPRPGAGLRARAGPAFARYGFAHRDPARLWPAPAWTLLRARALPVSSSALRSADHAPASL